MGPEAVNEMARERIKQQRETGNNRQQIRQVTQAMQA
jgi:hypothetical protein